MPDNRTFFSKASNIHFVVQNLSPNRKIHIFNYPLLPGQTRDLLAIPEISEEDIRHSLIKGELAKFLQMQVVSIVSSTINLLQLDASQSKFLSNAGGYNPNIANVPAVDPPGTLPSDSRIIYVNKSGSDANGDGSFLMPFLTISYALTQLADASQNLSHEIKVGPGNYTENLMIRPWIGITGEPSSSAYQGLTSITANSIGLDPTWMGTTYNVGWFNNLTFNTAPSFNFSGAVNGQLTFYDCLFNAGASFTGDGSGNVNNITWNNCLSYAAVNVSDCQYFFTIGGTAIQITGGGQALTVGSHTEATTWLGIGGAVNGNITISTPLASPAVAAQLVGCAVNGSLTLSGNVSYASTACGIPSNITLQNGAPPPTLLTKANAVGYVPAVSANWNNNAPTSVTTALDRIAAKVGPIT